MAEKYWLVSCLSCFYVNSFLLAAANWWFVAMPSSYQSNFEGVTTPNEYKQRCYRLDELLPTQRELCAVSANMLDIVGRGARIGLQECQKQFSDRHWNCSTAVDHLLFPRSASSSRKIINGISGKESVKSYLRSKGAKFNRSDKSTAGGGSGRGRKSLAVSLTASSTAVSDGLQADAPMRDISDLFGAALKYHTREKAYVHAISAAGVAFSVSKACTQGELPSCSCDRGVRQKEESEPGWEWGGCSEDVTYGAQLSRDFVDATDLSALGQNPTSDADSDAPHLMNLHNNEAGRRVLRRNVEKHCKCHGVSGSCTTKICWRQIRPFKFVGAALFRRFDAALQVIFNRRRRRLRPAIKGQRRARKRDLVYLEDSPDYCFVDIRKGVRGTRGRRCQVDSYDIDNCRVLCCGRGYNTVVVESERECDCKFVWCCEVKCSICRSVVTEHYCR